ncbi:MAG TPA: hypothetical protein VIC85_00460 [Ktedonobacterales bacterium]|jgi:hypothetical protein
MPEHLPVARAEAARVAGVALNDAPTATGPRSWANAAWVALAVLLVLITVSGLLSAFLAR